MIGFVNMNDLNGAEKVLEVKSGEKFTLSKDFDDVYGEHKSLLILKEGIGFRKIEVLDKTNRYICLKVI